MSISVKMAYLLPHRFSVISRMVSGLRVSNFLALRSRFYIQSSDPRIFVLQGGFGDLCYTCHRLTCWKIIPWEWVIERFSSFIGAHSVFYAMGYTSGRIFEVVFAA